MDGSKKLKSLAVWCGLDGKIEKILLDDILGPGQDMQDKNLKDLFDAASKARFEDALAGFIIEENFILKDSFTVKLPEKDKDIIFSICRIKDRLLVLGAEYDSGFFHVLQDVLDYIYKNRVKEYVTASRDEEVFNRLSTINNELVNTRRNLEKKKAEVEKINKKLEEINRIDSLTGLYNRRFFYEKITEEISRAQRLDYKLVIAYIDINNFKKINDQGGHEEGDRALKIFADISRNMLRKDFDHIFRFGGDEFLYLLTNCDFKEAEDITKRVNQEFIKNSDIASLAAGIVEVPVDGKRKENINIESYIRLADEKMYKNKKSNR
jgi:diguanylate cyclase (GGDEF)-like protein